MRDLNKLYVAEPALYENDADESGFEWIEADDSENSVFSFIRKASSTDQEVIILTNFTPIPRENYRVGVSEPGDYIERLNTDKREYGGSGITQSGAVTAQEEPWHYRHYSIEVTIPPLATVFIERQR